MPGRGTISVLESERETEEIGTETRCADKENEVPVAASVSFKEDTITAGS